MPGRLKPPGARADLRFVTIQSDRAGAPADSTAGAEALAPARVVRLGEIVTSTARRGLLATQNLGAGIAVAIFDDVERIGGVVHCLLPDSTQDPARAARRPGLFVDSGVTALITELERLGAWPRRARIWIAGGADPEHGECDEPAVFLGRRNVECVRDLLDRAGATDVRWAVGGRSASELLLDLHSGEADVRHPLLGRRRAR